MLPKDLVGSRGDMLDGAPPGSKCWSALHRRYKQVVHVLFLVNQIQLSIDPMHKWRRFECSFVYIEISPTSLVLELNFQKNMLPKMRLVGQI